MMCRDGRVDAQQPPCIATEKRCDGVIDCFGGEDEYCTCSPDGVVRLVGGRSPHEGRLEMCMNGQWARVCETGIRGLTAAVICRQLGYPTESRSHVMCNFLVDFMYTLVPQMPLHNAAYHNMGLHTISNQW